MSQPAFAHSLLHNTSSISWTNSPQHIRLSFSTMPTWCGGLKKDTDRNLHPLLLSTIVADSHLILSPNICCLHLFQQKILGATLTCLFSFITTDLTELDEFHLCKLYTALSETKTLCAERSREEEKTKQAASLAISKNTQECQPCLPTNSSVYFSTVPSPYETEHSCAANASPRAMKQMDTAVPESDCGIFKAKEIHKTNTKVWETWWDLTFFFEQQVLPTSYNKLLKCPKQFLTQTVALWQTEVQRMFGWQY